MLTFLPESCNAIIVMYPTGGFGNFLYHLLSEFFENTVKVDQSKFSFSRTGNSHSTNKYTETFALGPAYHNKTLKNFSYNYKVFSDTAYEQINAGKKFVVLGDVGNLGDNTKFLRKYFPNATILRIYAETFDEKLILWANCMNKAYNNLADPLYKDSLHSITGISAFSNKNSKDITDNDAVNCMLNFFATDFSPYGKYFSTKSSDAINIPVEQFFTIEKLTALCYELAKKLKTTIINQDTFESTLSTFIKMQSSFDLLSNSNNTLAGQAANIWRNKQ